MNFKIKEKFVKIVLLPSEGTGLFLESCNLQLGRKGAKVIIVFVTSRNRMKAFSCYTNLTDYSSLMQRLQ
jgi:hypothetical protein